MMGYRIGSCEPPLDPPDDYWSEDLPTPAMEDEQEDFDNAVSKGAEKFLNALNVVVEEDRDKRIAEKYRQLEKLIDDWRAEALGVLEDVQADEYERGEWENDPETEIEPPEEGWRDDWNY